MLLFLTSCAISSCAQAVGGSVKDNGNWVLKKDESGIKVFTRSTAAMKFNELKVECTFEGRISQMAAVLLDVSNHPRWAYKTAKSQLLKSVSATELFTYSEIECPWPFQNRDVVAHVTLAQDSSNKIMTFVSENVNGYLPDNPDKVRMKYSKVTWMVIPVSKTQFKVEYVVQVDPGGSVPAWLLNLFATRGPFETFLKLKDEIRLPQYVGAKFPFVVD